MYSGSYQQILNEIIELFVFSGSSLTISDIENLTCVEFEYYYKIFKEKFEKENENKNEFIQNTFEFARRCVEVICKTIASVWGGDDASRNSLHDFKYKK
ncbi:MAG: hypothetical protein NZZ41_01095 [Candidatus Dojkabacteria bacterium]|nr:hypothetical protein [Candidatus Dojkabacteria bacterium]